MIFLQGSGIIAEEKVERLEKQGVVDLFSKIAFSKYVMVMGHELSIAVTAPIRHGQVQASHNSSLDGRGICEVPSLTEELLAIHLW